MGELDGEVSRPNASPLTHKVAEVVAVILS